MHRVCVLLSTYNGEKYIVEQLSSILAQNNTLVEILIRDDGSTDMTVNVIMKQFSNYENIKLLKGENVGFICSFSTLVKLAIENNVIYDYYAFADQDDIWYPNKLYTACQKLEMYPEDRPNLFCSNSDLIDVNGKKTGIMFRQRKPHFTIANILMYSTLQGCSMVFNRKALEIFNNYPPQLAYHDRWMQYICCYMGNFYYEHKPLFGYRIHNGNALGLAKKGGLTFLWTRFKALITCDKNRVGFYDMTNEFYNAYKMDIPLINLNIIETYLSYRDNWKSKVKLILSRDFTCPIPKLSEIILMYIHILQNRI